MLIYFSKPFRVWPPNNRGSNMGKMYAGNVPRLSSGWKLIWDCVDGDNVEWLIFSKSQSHSPDWVTIKVVANGWARNKANYWMAKNIKTGKVGYAKDYAVMRESRPGLYTQVEDAFKILAAIS
jgi:hypothetical protein